MTARCGSCGQVCAGNGHKRKHRHHSHAHLTVFASIQCALYSFAKRAANSLASEEKSTAKPEAAHKTNMSER